MTEIKCPCGKTWTTRVQGGRTSCSQCKKNYYIRNVPVDPFTKTNESWLLVASEDPDHPGVRDIHSGSPDIGSDGSPFVSW